LSFLRTRNLSVSTTGRGVTVLFDLVGTQPIAGYRFHGGAEYGKQVFFRAIDAGWSKFHALYNPQFELEKCLLDACRAHDITLVPVSGWSDLSRVLATVQYSTFFSPLPYEYAEVDTLGVRFIMAIHGLRTLEMPSDPVGKVLRSGTLSAYWNALREPRKNAKRRKAEWARMWKLLSRENIEIVTGSRHSKYSIESFFPKVERKRIRIIHSPIDDMEDVADWKLSRRGDYYLLLGADRWVKNAHLTCKVLDGLISEDLLSVDRVLVLGCQDSAGLLAGLKNPAQFTVKGYVERQELAAAYLDAYCLIYPSLNEGFGYPPLNAMQLRTPVIASSLSAIPEVCGDAAVFFDPCSPEEIRNRILQIDGDRGLYEELVRKGERRFGELKNLEEEMMADLIRLIFIDDNSYVADVCEIQG
jgi:glycosyltransferase involved in cell wall biosynthesis